VRLRVGLLTKQPGSKIPHKNVSRPSPDLNLNCFQLKQILHREKIRVMLSSYRNHSVMHQKKQHTANIASVSAALVTYIKAKCSFIESDSGRW
jgi:hypothetical protein